MVAVSRVFAPIKVQADDRKELVEFIEAQEGYGLAGKIAHISGAYIATLKPIDAEEAAEEGGEEEGGEGEDSTSTDETTPTDETNPDEGGAEG